jgi:hypothetical protein
MKLIALLYWGFALFESVMGNQLRAISTAPDYTLSGLERKLASDSFIGVLFPVMMVIARFGAIAFLVYCAFKFVWYFPIPLYIGGICLSMLFIMVFKIDPYKTLRITLPGFVIMPILFVLMWCAAIFR